MLFHKGDVAKEMFLHRQRKIPGEGDRHRAAARAHHGRARLHRSEQPAHRTVESLENGEVLTITYDRLLELYFQNPEFGYYLLRLTTERLMQNIARLEDDAVGKQDEAARVREPAAKAVELEPSGSVKA